MNDNYWQNYAYNFALEKSDPLFFKMLLDDLDQEGEMLLFVDDFPRTLEIAAGYGITGIHY